MVMQSSCKVCAIRRAGWPRAVSDAKSKHYQLPDIPSHYCNTVPFDLRSPFQQLNHRAFIIVSASYDLELVNFQNTANLGCEWWEIDRY